MRHYKVNRLFHTVYEDSEELPANIRERVNYKRDHVNIGDWIETDDGCYMEVLRSGNMIKAKGKNRKI